MQAQSEIELQPEASDRAADVKGRSPGPLDDGGQVKRGARERIRTFDLLLRRQALYPLSYAGV